MGVRFSIHVPPIVLSISKWIFHEIKPSINGGSHMDWTASNMLRWWSSSHFLPHKFCTETVQWSANCRSKNHQNSDRKWHMNWIRKQQMRAPSLQDSWGSLQIYHKTSQDQDAMTLERVVWHISCRLQKNIYKNNMCKYTYYRYIYIHTCMIYYIYVIYWINKCDIYIYRHNY